MLDPKPQVYGPTYEDKFLPILERLTHLAYQDKWQEECDLWDEEVRGGFLVSQWIARWAMRRPMQLSARLAGYELDTQQILKAVKRAEETRGKATGESDDAFLVWRFEDLSWLCFERYGSGSENWKQLDELQALQDEVTSWDSTGIMGGSRPLPPGILCLVCEKRVRDGEWTWTVEGKAACKPCVQASEDDQEPRLAKTWPGPENDRSKCLAKLEDDQGDVLGICEKGQAHDPKHLSVTTEWEDETCPACGQPGEAFMERDGKEVCLRCYHGHKPKQRDDGPAARALWVCKRCGHNTVGSDLELLTKAKHKGCEACRVYLLTEKGRELIHGTEDPPPAEEPEEPGAERSPETWPEFVDTTKRRSLDGLKAMTMKDLRALAKRQGVSLKGCARRKGALVHALHLQPEGQPAGGLVSVCPVSTQRIEGRDVTVKATHAGEVVYEDAPPKPLEAIPVPGGDESTPDDWT